MGRDVHGKMSKINVALKDGPQNYKQHVEDSNRFPGNQLSADFATVYSDHGLDYFAWSATCANIAPIIPVDAISASQSFQQMWQTGTAHKVPNVSDAALFRKNAELGKGLPNRQHQRAFFQFKHEGTHNDPFDDAEEGEVEALEERIMVWPVEMCRTYSAHNIKVYQRRTGEEERAIV
ncbi:hypothetical protein DICSQDRAFT_181937 [Dichomitus squalens LYAD-421 SS1]|uniref:Uncharacterized protein n=1 Tax=Dichomitus squalens (strain LYAD-421) TaxID=732165 RepID=R7SWQ9_DICSQ|nr:uncharacterized protein DICSQDRAFT_181937 [Dichomitus squalens LYAD-421 SS1]EJF59422.1 hypothetical protein DICSQDRAFT_181937 [Dichomitus squalens LYAD-421 SS1]